MDIGPARIGDILRKPRKVVKAVSSLRAELVGKITDRLNKERGTKYEKLSYERVASLVAYIKGDSELYAFLRKLEGANSFTALFWWHVKPKKESVLQSKHLQGS
jgi:hypothetical protein